MKRFGWMITTMIAAALLGGCKGSFKPNEENGEQPLDIEFSGGRRLSISGRTMGVSGSGNQVQVALPGASILAVVNGVTYNVTSRENGSWAIRDVPMRPSRDANDTGDQATVVIYFERLGWTYDSDGGTLGNQNWVQIRVDADQADSTGNYHIDLGPVIFSQDTLKVTSSLIKSSTALTDRWLSGGTWVGSTPAERREVYMYEGDASITLQFNMPADVNYSQQFAELFRIDGTPVGFTGFWDVTGTLYSIVPNAPLVADNHDARQYLLRIARPVRAFNTVVATTHEIENVSFQFDVLKRTRDTLLLAQTPMLFPQVDGVGYSDYTFDYNRVYKVSTVSSSRVVDLVAHDMNLCIRWVQNPSARPTAGYRIYASNIDYRAGGWWDSTAHWTITLTGDGNAHACGGIGANNFLGADNVFSRGERLNLIVTPVDTDGNEGAISAITVPLSISDNWSPYLTAATYNRTYLSGERDQIFSSSPTGRVTLTFNEPIDLYSGVSMAAVTPLSGRMTSASLSEVRLTSATAATGRLNTAYAVADTATILPATGGQNTIHVASVVNLEVGDIVRISSPVTDVTESRTISQIRSLEGAIVFTANITGHYPAGSLVRLANSGGMTYYIGTVTANAYKEQDTISVTNASRFVVNQAIKIIRLDEAADTNVGTFTVREVLSSGLRLTSALSEDITIGSYVVDGATAVSEPQPRAATAAILPQDNLVWNASTASTTLTNDHFTVSPDTQTDRILVGSTTGFHIGDLITIAASNVSGVLTSVTASGGTVMNQTAHDFKVGDRVRLHPPSISTSISAVMATGATSAPVSSTITVENGESVTLTDPEFKTDLTSAAASGATTLSVASTQGITVGQDIVINSAVHAAETRTVSSVTSTSVTVSAGLTAAHSAGARVTRNALTENVNASALANGTSSVSIAATTNAYSLTARLTKARNYSDHTITAIAANTFTVNPAVGAITPRGSGARLLSATEARRITAFDGRLVTLNSALSYPHRAGAAVSRPSQFAATFLSADMAAWMLGDTFICDTLANPGDVTIPAHADRFEAVLLAMDTTSGYATFSTSMVGLIPTSNLTCTHMGDAVKLTGISDSNGQMIRSTWGNKFSITTVR